MFRKTIYRFWHLSTGARWEPSTRLRTTCPTLTEERLLPQLCHLHPPGSQRRKGSRLKRRRSLRYYGSILTRKSCAGSWKNRPALWRHRTWTTLNIREGLPSALIDKDALYICECMLDCWFLTVGTLCVSYQPTSYKNGCFVNLDIWKILIHIDKTG